MEAAKLFEKIHSSNEDELVELIKNWQEYKASEVLAIYDFIQTKSPVLDTGMDLYDCCGTGGDGANTFNISTCAAIIAASLGIKICKNGGRSSTSKVGSVDVLEELGFDFSKRQEEKIELLKKFNLSFISSPVSAELMAPLKKVSRKYKLPSILSLIGPLTNPLKLKSQVIGIGKEKWLDTMQEISQELIKRGDREKIILVHSKDLASERRLDELSTATSSKIIEISKASLKEFDFDPKKESLKTGKFEDLGGGDNSTNADLIKEILDLSGEGPEFETRINSVCINVDLLSYLANGSLEWGKSANLLYTGTYDKKIRNIFNNASD